MQSVLTLLGNVKNFCQKNRNTCLSAFHHAPVREEAEVGGEEDDVGDEDDAYIVRDLQTYAKMKSLNIYIQRPLN